MIHSKVNDRTHTLVPEHLDDYVQKDNPVRVSLMFLSSNWTLGN
jgi:hypothetical protein